MNLNEKCIENRYILDYKRMPTQLQDPQQQDSRLKVSYVEAFEDNYIWLIHSQNKKQDNAIIIVDPGDHHPVIEAIEKHQYQPFAIFLTHHHGDHTAGVRLLLEKYDIPVYGPKNENIPTVTVPCEADDTIVFSSLNLAFKVLEHLKPILPKSFF